jgi:hypothetical protein
MTVVFDNAATQQNGLGMITTVVIYDNILMLNEIFSAR